jgi:hypothetical protein
MSFMPVEIVAYRVEKKIRGDKKIKECVQKRERVKIGEVSRADRVSD